MGEVTSARESNVRPINAISNKSGVGVKTGLDRILRSNSSFDEDMDTIKKMSVEDIERIYDSDIAKLVNPYTNDYGHPSYDLKEVANKKGEWPSSIERGNTPIFHFRQGQEWGVSRKASPYNFFRDESYTKAQKLKVLKNIVEIYVNYKHGRITSATEWKVGRK